MKRVHGAVLYDGSFNLQRKDMIVGEDGRIVEIIDPDAGRPRVTEHLDLTGSLLVPGLIDVHIHGSDGADTMDADPAACERVSAYLARQGVTGFLATTMTVPPAELEQVFRLNPDPQGARLLGYNMEGPFINVERRGAHRADSVRPADADEFRRYLNEARIRIVTIAPEMEGALPFIRAFADDVVISIGHTNADYDQTIAAIEAGARSLTHTFNAMPGIHHRRPGPVPAAVERGLYAEIITDNIHIHPSVIYSAYRLFGPDRLVIISDSMRAGGLPDGDYELGGLPVIVEDGIARNPDGTLAGGTSTVWQGVLNAIDAGIPQADAFRMASLNAASLIGLAHDLGSLEPGKRADFLVLGPELELRAVYMDGRPVPR